MTPKQTFVTFSHPVCLQRGIFQKRMVFEEEDFFFVKKFINVLLCGAEQNFISGFGENTQYCFQLFLLVFASDRQLDKKKSNKMNELMTF